MGSSKWTRSHELIADVGILVFGHIGLTPQFAAQMGGYKAQGKSAEAAQRLLEEALRIQEAGACAILVEGVLEIVGKLITNKLSIPVLGIGAGSFTDGQLLIYADMVGYYDNFTPKFVKKYAEVGKLLEQAFTEYVAEVRAGQFPIDGVHTYKISEEERNKIENLL